MQCNIILKIVIIRVQPFLEALQLKFYLIILMEIIHMEHQILVYNIQCQYQLYLIWHHVLKYFQQHKQ